MANIDQIIVVRFTNLYGAPLALDPVRFVDEYKTAMASCDSSLLERAIDRVVQRHNYPTWPTVGECVNAYRALSSDRARANEKEIDRRQEIPKREPPSKESRERVAKMVEECKARLLAVDTIGCAIPTATWQAPNRDQWFERQQRLLREGKWCASSALQVRGAR
jgi:hypothetical protein